MTKLDALTAVNTGLRHAFGRCVNAWAYGNDARSAEATEHSIPLRGLSGEITRRLHAVSAATQQAAALVGGGCPATAYAGIGAALTEAVLAPLPAAALQTLSGLALAGVSAESFAGFPADLSRARELAACHAPIGQILALL